MPIRNRLIGIVAALSLICGPAYSDGIFNPQTVAAPAVAFASLPAAGAVAPGTIYRVTNVGVNGSYWTSNGTKWAPVNGAVVLVQNSMAWINISSGSISSIGALTGITALSYNPGKAWIWLPANAVAASSPAGWYYCVFSSTTAGTVYLNQPAATFPVVWPASPTAVTAGQGSYTGAASAANPLPTITLIANSLGINGQLRVKGFGGASSTTGTVFFQLDNGNDYTSMAIPNTTVSFETSIGNRGVANLQAAFATAQYAASGAAYTNASNLAADTTTDLSAVGLTLYAFTHSTENVFVDGFSIVLYNDGQ